VTTDHSVTIAGVDLSDHITAVELPVEVETQDSTAMGDTWRESTAGLKSGSVTIGFHQDYAASEVDATLWDNLGTAVTIVVKPTSSAVSATNPSYSGSFIVTQTSPVAGTIGELNVLSVTFPLTGALTKATS
jgi:hypothetical protein